MRVRENERKKKQCQFQGELGIECCCFRVSQGGEGEKGVGSRLWMKWELRGEKVTDFRPAQIVEDLNNFVSLATSCRRSH